MLNNSSGRFWHKRAEQARLAKLEKDREGFLAHKLAQVQERDQLATFMASLTAGPANDHEAAYRAFQDWTQQRLDRMNARLSPQAIARELSGIEAFLPPDVQSDDEGQPMVRSKGSAHGGSAQLIAC